MMNNLKISLISFFMVFSISAMDDTPIASTYFKEIAETATRASEHVETKYIQGVQTCMRRINLLMANIKAELAPSLKQLQSTKDLTKVTDVTVTADASKPKTGWEAN